MANKTLSSLVGGGGLPALTSLTKKSLSGRPLNNNGAVASLSASQPLTTILDITSPVAIGTLFVGAGGSAMTIDRIIITSDKGVLYDGDASINSNGSSWFLGSLRQFSNGSTINWVSSNQSFRAESLKIELQTTSSSAVYVHSDLELIE